LNLIIGIDPSINTGVAVLDMHSKLVNVYNKAGEAFELVVRQVLLKDVKDIDTGVKNYKAKKND